MGEMQGNQTGYKQVTHLYLFLLKIIPINKDVMLTLPYPGWFYFMSYILKRNQ